MVRVDVRDVGADDLHVAVGTLRFALAGRDAGAALLPPPAQPPTPTADGPPTPTPADPYGSVEPKRSQSQIIIDSKGAASRGRTGAVSQIRASTGASRSPTVAGSSSR